MLRSAKISDGILIAGQAAIKLYNPNEILIFISKALNQQQQLGGRHVEGLLLGGIGQINARFAARMGTAHALCVCVLYESGKVACHICRYAICKVRLLEHCRII